MVDNLRDTTTFLLTKKSSYDLLKFIFDKLGEKILEIDNDSIFNQPTYATYAPSREGWVIRNIVYENNKTIRPFLPQMEELCKSSNIPFFMGYDEEGVTVDVDDEVFNIGY